MDCKFDMDYPRPQFKRDYWLNLNGEWDFCFDDNDEGKVKKYYENFNSQYKIKVPFTYETEASGINDPSQHNVVWYRKDFCIDQDLSDEKVLLNFEGSDYETEVWVNGVFVGKNVGGYSRFSFAIENYLSSGVNNLTVRIKDSLSKSQPRGKQRYKKDSFKCWYIQTTGIWKTVWLEFVSKQYLKDVKITPEYDNKKVNLVVSTNMILEDYEKANYELGVCISFNGIKTNDEIFKLEDNLQEIDMLIDDTNGDIHRWNVLDPNLYDIKFALYKNGKIIDAVNSYFGVRKLEIKGNKIFLNDEELYQRLILDQGYWQTTHLTPPSADKLVDDIKSVIKFGYNGVRKHQKNEDERFLYWCDKLGVLVWSEMANCYEFNDDALENFSNEWVKVVKQNYNHPCIITWVPINESWGVVDIDISKKEQDFVNHLYYLTKSLDNTRFVISNDGWEHTISDVITIHDYKQNASELKDLYVTNKDYVLISNVNYNGERSLMAGDYKYNVQPIIMSEYGGIALESQNGWGYGKQVASEEEFLERFQDLTNVIKGVDYISGYCYTQLTDVQQEINGLLDVNHKNKFSDNINEKIAKINLVERK